MKACSSDGEFEDELIKAPRGNSKNRIIINSKENKTLYKTENIILIFYETQSWAIYIKYILNIDLTRKGYLTMLGEGEKRGQGDREINSHFLY